VEGKVNGIEKFKQEASLQFNSKTFSMISQTDKKIYKPSDSVQFRLMIVNENIKPLLIRKAMSVYIEDPRGNRVKQWENVTMNNGVYTNNFKLASEPSLGMWSINFVYGNEIQYQKFEVARYVLPKIEVTVTQGLRNTFKSGKMVVQVVAKYTYGKPVKGLATVKADNLYGFSSNRPNSFYRKVVPINEKAIVEFDIERDFGKRQTSGNVDVNIEASVTDELTGTVFTGKGTIKLYDDDGNIDSNYELRVSDYDTNFKPGLPYTFTITASRLDGSPVIDAVNPVNVNAFFGWNDNASRPLLYKLDNSGKVEVTLTAPLSAEVLDFEVHGITI
jgi:CD109 antigen